MLQNYLELPDAHFDPVFSSDLQVSFRDLLAWKYYGSLFGIKSNSPRYALWEFIRKGFNIFFYKIV
jgi:hypothetical protein